MQYSQMASLEEASTLELIRQHLLTDLDHLHRDRASSSISIHLALFLQHLPKPAHMRLFFFFWFMVYGNLGAVSLLVVFANDFITFFKRLFLVFNILFFVLHFDN